MEKFLCKYCFDEGFIFLDKDRILQDIKKTDKEKFEEEVLDYLLSLRKQPDFKEQALGSYQFFIYVIDKMRKNTVKQTEALTMYLLQLKESDMKWALRFLQKTVELEDWQKEIIRRRGI